jgi:hypothetical protein
LCSLPVWPRVPRANAKRRRFAASLGSTCNVLARGAQYRALSRPRIGGKWKSESRCAHFISGATCHEIVLFQLMQLIYSPPKSFETA